jgi:hypothetical protein
MSPLMQALNLPAKSMAFISYTTVLQSYKIAGMRKVIAALTEQRSCKRQYI